ncbi:syntaxin-binding protein 5-like isoform X6 [Choloepus didactylus]|uniref:syntaxin-binding protein 5-like isoform X6 n=1 Tax=Choloepus didactylus TaxID=27675 RepID=UPI00189F35F8|nr:syntaxin-binding protein 5-like isoform X6 [Choloepus didactylus]
MRKFNIRKVLDGLTAGSSSAAQPPPPAPPGSREPEVAETLQAEHFQLCKTVRHGFPYRPSALAFDPVQKILAVGTQLGALRLLQVHFQTTSTESCIYLQSHCCCSFITAPEGLLDGDQSQERGQNILV